MAQVAEIENVHVEKDAESTDSVRPSGNEAQRKRPNLPPIIGGAFTIPFDDACQYTAKLTERDWAHIEGYVFRLKPRLLRLPPLDKNIGFISGPISKQWVLDNFGSGKFQLKLNDTDRTNKKGIFETFVEYDDPDYPPKYDIRELDIAHRENRQLVEHLKRTGKLTADGDVVTKGPDSDATAATALRDVTLEALRMRQDKPGLEGQAFSKMMDMMSNASSKSIEIALSQLKGNEKAGADPMFVLIMQFMMKQLELAEKRHETKPAEGDSQQFTMLMRMLDASEKRAEQAAKEAKDERDRSEKERQRAHELELAQRKQAHDLEMERLKQKAEQVSPVAMVKEVLNLQKEIGNLGGGDSRNWKEKLVDEGMQHVPELFSLAGKAIDRINYSRTQPPAAPQPQQRSQQQPPAAQAPSQTQPQPQPAQPQGAQPMPEVPLDPDIAFLLPILEAQGRNVVEAFKNDPNSGADMARTLSLFAGEMVYQRIARMGQAKIWETVELLPQMKIDMLKAAGSTGPNDTTAMKMITDFLEDFCDPEDPDEDDDDPNEPEPDTDPSRPVEIGKGKV